MKTLLLETDTSQKLAAAIEAACVFLGEGQPVAIPTETVYGLGADALCAKALARIFEAKERPFFDPLILHLPDREWAGRLAKSDQKLCQSLMDAFWPGPLTLVLPKRDEVPDLATSGLPTVALRMSAHPVMNALLQEFGRPVAAPSANRFGRISPTCAQHVYSELNGRIPLILDGGSTDVGIESTIVAVEGSSLRILRSGPITAETLADFAPLLSAESVGSAPQAPGQLKSHYAPSTPMKIAPMNSKPEPEMGRKCALLAWTSKPSSQDWAAVEVLSPSGNLHEAASVLFGAMRRLDEASLDLIIAEQVPMQGIGVAIMDRLRKASARD